MAQDMVARLRAFRPIAGSYLPGAANPGDLPLAIIVFANQRDFRRAIDGRDVVGYMQPSFTESLMVVGPDPHAHSEHESLLHEYVHYLLRTRTDINIPPWFDEGLAGFLSSARPEDGRIVVGDLPRLAIRNAMDHSRLRLSSVLEAEDIWQWHPNRRRSFYAWSRLLVHWLLLGHGEAEHSGALPNPALAAFLRGEHDSLADALNITTGSMEHTLQRYLRRPPTVSHAVDGGRPPANRLRCLDESEKTLRLALAIVPHNADGAARQLRDRLQEDASNAELWTALSLAEEARGNRDGNLAAARHAVSLDGSDVSATVRLAGALAMGCILEISPACRERWQEAVPLLRQALRGDPARQDAIFTLGLAYLYSGRAGDAVNYLRIAHRRQPWAPHVNFYLGEAYRIIGDVRAADHLQRAQRWSATELWRKLAAAGLERLQGESG